MKPHSATEQNFNQISVLDAPPIFSHLIVKCSILEKNSDHIK